MLRILNGVAAMSILASGAAMAQSSLPLDYRSSSSLGFFISGYADLSYGFYTGFSDKSLAITEVDFGFRPPDGGFGYALGIDAFALRNPGADVSEIALYPVATFGTEFGTFSAGIPRSVVDRGYIARNRFANSSQFHLQFFQATSSAAGSAYLLNSDTPYGLRYDAVFGQTSVGLSYHRFDSGIGVNVFSLAIRQEFAAISSLIRFALFAGLENASGGGGFNQTNTTIGFESGNDQFNAGLTFRHNETLGTDITTGFVEYMINDLTFSGAIMDISGGPTFYGLGAEYRFQNNAYVDFSVVDGNTAGSKPVYEISVGFRF